ncbi:DNA internalization-related competence protein ComEC/Rec2 [Burkholderia glumae]|uniref:DNA internalization-related competence protein ComEC/Rec2 n=1 Tax=Burkholderia glumae TaxID=337 RepID=UPI000F5DD695|nr:DNA internalization-related competence protein ComEC/Rec2 [Burkholderia glumae]MCQ0031019.1 DNA internalization-related competence protein ComEC/Rec2 [Burkholderia glumae]MCQ0035203.1 DNA internalization-related competence protein ComEC/Rec2 [Burkholderia glumae]RQZ74534.1 DNA internalization-related competence protein ComEC/Rec2 [Burkholderia glumae]UVS86670.1 DNA internalization-related competence protein ComEC/Rec2 [Burkholderia glumae]
MREGWIAFALGIVLLQRQAVLPDPLELALVATACAVLAAAAWRWRQAADRRAMRWAAGAAMLTLAVLIGFAYAAVRAHWRLADSLPLEWERRDIVVTGVVHGLPVRDDAGLRFVLEVDGNEAGLARFPARLRLAWITRGRQPAPPVMRPGERWRLTVRLKRPHGHANRGGRDAEAGWLANGIRALGYVSSPRLAARLEPGGQVGLHTGLPMPRAAIDRLRFALRERIRAVLGGAPHAGIVIALAIGAQDDISQGDWQVLRATGTSHLVAISGLHISLVGGFAGALAAALWRRASLRGRALPLFLPAQYAGACMAVCAAGAYAALAGFNVPAQRAWWMLTAACVAYLSGRTVAPSTTLAFALGCVLIADPWAVLAPGFWLSFCAVAVILFAVSGRRVRRSARGDPDFAAAGEPERTATGMPASPPAASPVRSALAAVMRAARRVLRERLRRAGPRFVAGVRTQYAVTLGLAPLTVVWFGQIPLGGAPANAVAIPWVSLLVTPLVLAGVALPAPLDALALRAARALLAVLFAGFDAAGMDGRTMLWMPSPHWPALVAACIGMGWALMPRGWPLRCAAPLACLPFVLPPSQAPPPGAFRLTLLDVGQGLSAVVETARHVLVFDAGPGAESTHAGERVVVPYLRSRGIHALDALMISHPDADHAGGAAAVLEALPVRQLTGSLPRDAPLWRRAREGGVRDRLVCAAGQRWRWDGVTFAVLWPRDGPRAAASNARSCVLRVSAGGQAALLTGDIERGAERALLAASRARLAADVLVVPHHGSRTSSWEPFVDAVAPRSAWFPLGYANRFGHPHPTVWARFVERGVPLARTDRDGEVSTLLGKTGTLAQAGGGLQIERYRAAHRRYWMER